MKRLTRVLITTSLALTCLPACAGHRGQGYDYAKVISASPIYETVRYPVDEQVCWSEPGHRRPHHSVAPVILGGTIGGVVGNQFGGGHGNTALTVAGVAIGGAIGYQTSQRHHSGNHSRCQIQRSWRSEAHLTAWDVTYRYHGNIYRIQTPQKPGKKIRIQTYR